MHFIRSLTAALPLAVLLAACGSDTVVDVTIHAEPTIASRAARLELSANGRRPGESWDAREGGDAVILTGSDIVFPVRYRYTARRETEGREYRVNVRAYDLAGNRLTVLRVVGTYRPGETHRHVVRLDDACLFRVCSDSEQTCQAGRCVDARDVTWDLDASTEPPPPPPRPDAGADATAEAGPADAAVDAGSDASTMDAASDASTDAAAPMMP